MSAVGRTTLRRMKVLLTVVVASALTTLAERLTPPADQARGLAGLALFVSLTVALNYWWDRRTA